MSKIGRNHPCPCGSAKKYKRCCGALNPSPVTPEAANAGAKPAASGSSEQLEVLERASLSGDVGAHVRLGLRCLTGQGIPFNPTRGVALMEKAALAGDARAAAIAATLASSFFWRERNWDQAFDHLMRSAALGHQRSQSALAILAGGPSGDTISGKDWARMRGKIDMAAWLAPPEIQLLRAAPHIQAIEKFAPPAACDWLIEQAKDGLSRATIYDKATGGTTEDLRRTNSQCDLDVQSSGVLTFVLRARIAAIVERHDKALEIPKVLHYAVGQTFAEHFDYLDPKVPAYTAELAKHGQRTHTFLIYLNGDYQGGETRFPRVGITHKGIKGNALLFANVDAAGLPDEDTMHVGMPPTVGEKWVFSQWIREFPKA